MTDVKVKADDYLLDIANDLDSSSKDLRIAHLNICRLRNKIEELRTLQNICRFDILGISESHFNSSDADHNIHIHGYRFIWLDRTKCGGSVCVMYYVDHLKIIHRKDLAISDFKAIWIQVKFPLHRRIHIRAGSTKLLSQPECSSKKSVDENG